MTTKMSIPSSTISGSPTGATCTMIRMFGKGIKVFEYREDRDRAYNNQVRLAALGLAPEAYYKGEIEIDGSVIDNIFEGYVYETELAVVFNDSEFVKYGDEWVAARKPFADAIEGLQAKLKEIGCIWEDDSAKNIGFIDGHVVLIDCGDDLFGTGDVVCAGGRHRDMARY